MHFHHAAGRGQSQPDASVLGRNERFEQAVSNLGVDARAMVANPNLAAGRHDAKAHTGDAAQPPAALMPHPGPPLESPF